MGSRSPFRKPCVERLGDDPRTGNTKLCGMMTEPGENRCAAHQAAWQRRKNEKYGRNAEAQTLRRALNRSKAVNCEDCGLMTLTENVEIDHVVPLSEGGKDSFENLQVLCISCHNRKKSRENKARARRRPAGYELDEWPLG